MFKDIAYLGIVSDSLKLGETVEAVVYDKLIYCEEKSVKYSEFYQAQATDFKPEIVLITSRLDYNKERYIKYDAVEYSIIRAYKVENEKIELVLEKV